MDIDKARHNVQYIKEPFEFSKGYIQAWEEKDKEVNSLKAEVRELVEELKVHTEKFGCAECSGMKLLAKHRGEG